MYICIDLETIEEKAALSINRSSFEELFNTFWKRMFAFAVKMTEDDEDAKEIVQEVFKSLWERRIDLSIKDAERYLLRSVKLKSLEYIRNKATRQKHHDLILKNSKIDYEDHHLQEKELKDKLDTVVDSLPKQCKNVFKMSREEGLTNKEIAQVLFISERAVEYHISRALSTLRIALEQQA